MDRSWINARRTSETYENGVEQFLEFAKRNVLDNKGVFYCPCVNCLNEKRLNVADIKEHVLCDGFSKSYTRWIWHGELEVSRLSEQREVDVDMDDRLEDMIRDVGVEAFARAHVHDTLCSDAEKPLYPGCNNFTRLLAVLRLVNLKAANGWSDKSFTDLLCLLKHMLPEDNELPDCYYDAKKILCPMGLQYKKIHACPNDCILYRDQYEGLHVCPKCGAARYKTKEDCNANCDAITKGPPAKVLWYLPIIPRLKRLFANAKNAKNLRWHVDERISDGKLRHPADSLQWKKIDELFPEFGNEPRNIRLGFCTDGVNPYGNLSSKHSSWPVLLVIYNLSPRLCMKRKYIIMSMMISGPKQPGNDIDVYLGPLIQELKRLWEEGEDVFDAYKKENFKMRAMIFCTINDFPAYGNLSGYSVKGHKACPICEEGTSYHQLRHGKKTVYLGHRRFLRRSHPYRRLKKAFNGLQENDEAPIALTAEQVYERVKGIDVIFGKTQKATKTSPWKKRSIFFDLPYWKNLDVRHSIDVMHVEKNVCDSIIGTLLNIQGKTKDGVNTRLDLVAMGIRGDLAPQPQGKRTYLPPASHTLSINERRSFCECLHGVKVPQGYSSNVKSLVSIKDMKLVGLKSHDCHVLMQQLLPVAIRGILPNKLRQTLTRLCFFFNSICSKVIDPKKLDELENDAALILCQLEMYFPPSFFDIMVHLIIHLVREIRLCGPVYLRWMYPFERYMKILKGYVKNPRRPEASIVQRYIAEEAVEFCSEYLSEVAAIGLPKSRHEGRVIGKGTRGVKVITMSRDEVLQAHRYILSNTDEVQPYIAAHNSIIRVENPRRSDKWLVNKHNRTFLSWFNEQVKKDENATDTIKWLAGGPQFEVVCWSGYDINGYSFYTKAQDEKSTMQNSGVTIVAESIHFSSSKDKNPVTAAMPYFGVIEDIWDVDYTKFRVPIFKCKWVDSNHGIEIDESGFTLVDLNILSYTDEPFIMATQAKQVFYVTDPSNKRLSVVLQGKRVIVGDENDELSLDICHTPSFSSRPLELNEEDEVDDVYAVRDDHHEGIWENIPT